MHGDNKVVSAYECRIMHIDYFVDYAYAYSYIYIFLQNIDQHGVSYASLFSHACSLM